MKIKITKEIKNHCAHIESDDFYCVLGSFQVKPSQIICPNCGKSMSPIQSDIGSDHAICQCGTVVIFNNQGNRLSAFELWKKGKLVGT